MIKGACSEQQCKKKKFDEILKTIATNGAVAKMQKKNIKPEGTEMVEKWPAAKEMLKQWAVGISSKNKKISELAQKVVDAEAGPPLEQALAAFSEQYWSSVMVDFCDTVVEEKPGDNMIPWSGGPCRTFCGDAGACCRRNERTTQLSKDVCGEDGTTGGRWNYVCVPRSPENIAKRFPADRINLLATQRRDAQESAKDEPKLMRIAVANTAIRGLPIHDPRFLECWDRCDGMSGLCPYCSIRSPTTGNVLVKGYCCRRSDEGPVRPSPDGKLPKIPECSSGEAVMENKVATYPLDLGFKQRHGCIIKDVRLYVLPFMLDASRPDVDTVIVKAKAIISAVAKLHRKKQLGPSGEPKNSAGVREDKNHAADKKDAAGDEKDASEDDASEDEKKLAGLSGEEDGDASTEKLAALGIDESEILEEAKKEVAEGKEEDARAEEVASKAAGVEGGAPGGEKEQSVDSPGGGQGDGKKEEKTEKPPAAASFLEGDEDSGGAAPGGTSAGDGGTTAQQVEESGEEKSKKTREKESPDKDGVKAPPGGGDGADPNAQEEKPKPKEKAAAKHDAEEKESEV